MTERKGASPIPPAIKSISLPLNVVSTDKIVILCGPPIMIKFTLAGLQELGFEKTQVYTTLELRMKCGVGKCGRCNVGSKYVCKDGPVFRFDQVDELPTEYYIRICRTLWSAMREPPLCKGRWAKSLILPGGVVLSNKRW